MGNDSWRWVGYSAVRYKRMLTGQRVELLVHFRVTDEHDRLESLHDRLWDDHSHRPLRSFGLPEHSHDLQFQCLNEEKKGTDILQWRNTSHYVSLKSSEIILSWNTYHFFTVCQLKRSWDKTPTWMWPHQERSATQPLRGTREFLTIVLAMFTRGLELLWTGYKSLHWLSVTTPPWVLPKG